MRGDLGGSCKARVKLTTMPEPSEKATQLPTVPSPGESLPNSARRFCLVTLTGPNKGAVHQLQPGRQVLGASSERATFGFTGRGVSPVHAEVELTEEGSVHIRDLDSEDGTFVNGERIEELTTLASGDTLIIGIETEIRLETPDGITQNLMQDMYRGVTRDLLTGLLNRKSFFERLGEECAAAGRHGLESCLAMLDVDNFKAFNEEFGVAAGDAVLVELSKRITAHVRLEDVLCRYGGEQFVVLIRLAPLEGATLLMERIRASVAERPVLTNHGLQNITISIGLTALTQSFTPDLVINAARRALKEAKKQGRNRVCARRL